MKNLIKIIFLTLFLCSCVAVNAQRKRSVAKQKKATPATKKTKKDTKKPKGRDVETKTTNGIVQAEVIALSQDTTKPNVVTITSAFKPSLRSAVKINFTASTPELDTNRFSLNYNIPAQNLIFSYQPVPIKPLALTSDSDFTWQNHQYVKAGFGNYTTPYFETGLAFGHPASALYTVFGKFVSSKGSEDFQKYTNAQLKVSAAFGGITNHDLLASVSYNLSNQNKYGVKAASAFNKDSLAQNFNTVEADISLHSKKENNAGISYHPQIKASVFFDNNQANETNIALKLPFTKSFTTSTSFTLGAVADITSYKINTNKIENNLFAITPSFKMVAKDYKINIGIQPTWDNSVFSFLPNVNGEYRLAETFAVTAGWVGSFQKNTYKTIAAINPFIEQPTNLTNTKINEIYAGFKGGVGKHFTFNGQLSFLKFTNQLLFVNDAIDSKSQTFNILYEPDLKAIRIGGEIGYTDKEKFSLLSSIKYTQFTSQQLYPKAYGFVPLEINASAKYKLLKDVFVKGDLFMFAGNYYRIQTIQTEKTSAAFDLNLGAEFNVLKNLNAYIDFNNLFNNKYQRWNQYNVFGFNVVGGFVYSFH